MSTTRTTGREYLRVSLDRSGRARSVEEQHDDNARSAADRRVRLGKPYVDNSVSASRYTTKTRDDFARLLDDLRHGRFGADELWLWEPSRGSRRVGEWVDLIDACEQAGVSIYVTTHGRAYDPANGRDRRSLLEDAVDSEYESSKVSARAKRAAAANAAAGKPHGPTPYGYRRIYDPETRRLVRQEAHPDEAPIIREMYQRLRAGHSLRAIARDLDARGVRTRTGKPFAATHVRSLVLSPTYAGIRTHVPHRSRPTKHTLDGAVKGTWEPLVSEDTYDAVRKLLTAKERRTSRPGRAKHLLSMIAKCAVCEGPLAVTFRSDGSGRPPVPMYQCHTKGCVRVDKAELDALAEARILAHLAKPDAYRDLLASEADDEQLRRIRSDLAVVDRELTTLRAEVAAGRLSVANLAAIAPAMEKRLDDLRAQERALSTPNTVAGMIKPGPGVARRWKDAESSARREVARMLLTADSLGELRVDRRPRDAGPVHVPAQERSVFWPPQAERAA